MSKASTGKAKYCKIIRQVKVRENDESYSIEKIFINSKYEEEIRFSYYKDIIRNGIFRKEYFVPRPLDISEDKLIELISQAIKKKVFSKEFVEKLREIIA